jgi:DNA replication licensing factor MCM2
MMKSRRRVIREQGATADDEADQPFVLEQYAGMSLREWVSQNKVRAEIKRRFKLFLQSPSRDDAEQAHQKAIDRMCSENLQSLEISYTSLSIFAPTLAIWLADVPKIMLEIFNEGSKEVVNEYYPDYNTIHDEIYVRITNLPVLDKLRDLRQMHLNVLVRLGGVVVRRSGVNPQMKIVRFRCRCGNNTQPFVIHNNEMPHVGICPECQNNGPYEIINEQTVYRNYQRLSLQESPGTVPPGRVPRQKEVILLADLIDSARPGEEIEVTGIYVNTFSAVTNVRNGFPVFNTSIEANYVMRKSDPSAGRNITEENRRQFEELKRDPRIIRRVIRSIAPSIYGNEHVKLGVALAMFGGSEKNVNQKHRIRGDINVLVLGDPGTAKSQVLKYVEKTAPRCVYTTGKGASAVGLTAAVHKDPLTGEWVLEGGALVLADRGVCCIDEFDKMTDQDRTSIHEAMEQQSISISKAGIVTSLQARCAVIAAANPIGGRYDPSKTFSENVQLTDPILTRFDVLCVLRDEVDPVADERLATFVVQSHFRSHPKRIADEKIRQEALLNAAAESGSGSGTGGAPVGNTTEDSTFAAPAADGDDAILPIPQDLLRKYILYARDLKPTLTNIDQGKVVRLYTDLRKESEISNGVPVAVRHIESIMRISEAVCRMRLGTVVSDSDLNTAMKVMLESFITAQKHATQRPLRRQFARYLQIDDNYNTLLLVMLKELRVLVQEQAVEESLSSNSEASADEIKVKLSKLVERARRHGITDLSSFLDNSASLRKQGYIYDRTNEVLIYKHGSFLDATLA